MTANEQTYFGMTPSEIDSVWTAQHSKPIISGLEFVKDLHAHIKTRHQYTRTEIDRSDEADARRMRWILSGNGYFMEEEMLCGHDPCEEAEQDMARRRIDEAMKKPD